MRENLILLYTNNKDADQPAQMYVKADQRLCCSHSWKSNSLTCFRHIFNITASLCNWVVLFEPYMVANLDDKFSRIKARFLKLQKSPAVDFGCTLCLNLIENEDQISCFNVNIFSSSILSLTIEL